MNEQDFMNQLKDDTRDLPIPDSISPENMKQMLDKHINETNNSDKKSNTNDSQPSALGKRNRTIRRFTAAACITLCLVGGIVVHQLNSEMRKLADTSQESSGILNEMYAETEDAAEFPISEETGNEKTNSEEGTTDDLVYQSSLESPSSYDDYYNTLKKAYDDYYEAIAAVTKENADFNDWSDEYNDTQLDDALDIWDTESFGTNANPSIQEGSGSLRGDTVELKEEISSNDKSTSESESSKEFSTTNTQEKRVDEGDIIKTDGTYIYKLISRPYISSEYKFIITETDNGALKVLATINLNELLKGDRNPNPEFHEFYLYENYVLIMYTIADYSVDTLEPETRIAIYDIKNKEHPKKIRTLTQSGWYESSRISDGFLYTISNFYKTSLETPVPYSNYVPSINGNLIDCKNIYYPKNILMDTTCVITSLNLNKPTDFTDSKAIPTKSGQTYVSSSSIYIYTTLYEDVQKTEITKIRYDQGVITPGESSIITGYLYGSFALSEHNNHLRIVATIPANNISLLRFEKNLAMESSSDMNSSEDIKIKEDINVLYILDDNMDLVGKLSGIAPGEQIYSARFMGDIGYFVTFKQVDPLFSVDLSDPTNPKILGALKIPGFSNYLHFYDDNLLLGLGEEIDAYTSAFEGLKLSMFDISNPANVTEQDKYIIEKSSYSNAQYDYKAIMIDPAKNIFGFLYESVTDNYEWESYYVTYTYDDTKGFIETAKYLIPDEAENEPDGIRGLYIGDYFYLTTNIGITSYEIGSTEPIAQVYFK